MKYYQNFWVTFPEFVLRIPHLVGFLVGARVWNLPCMQASEGNLAMLAMVADAQAWRCRIYRIRQSYKITSTSYCIFTHTFPFSPLESKMELKLLLGPACNDLHRSIAQSKRLGFTSDVTQRLRQGC